MIMSLYFLLLFIVAILITLTVHETAHALTAYYLGDPTARNEGRISLNPVRHLDLYGSLIFLFTLLIGRPIGWGKPVPVNPRNFRFPVRDNALTALAGPLSNFVMALLLAIPLKYLRDIAPDMLLQFLRVLFDVNVLLGIFNLFPFPPLDGSKIIGLIIPRKWHRQYEHYLEEGMKYSIALILIDVFIVADLFGMSILGFLIGYLYHYVSLALLLGA